MRRAVEAAAALLVLSLAAVQPASAEELSAPAPALRAGGAPAAFALPTLTIEVGGGVGSPLGSGFVDAVYSPNRWLALGAGGGFFQPEPGIPAYIGKIVPRVGAFARGYLLRWRGLAVGPVLTLSRGDLAHGERYMRPQYAPDSLAWSWQPGYRLDGGVGVELHGHRVSARLEAGVGYVLNQPTCTYAGAVTWFQGSCDSPEIPTYYHFSTEPGRVTPYISLAVGVGSVASDAPPPDEPLRSGETVAGARADDPRVDTVWAAPTALTQPKGRIAVTVYELFMPNVTVGVTDRLQVAAGLGWFYFSGGPLTWDASVKLAVARASRVHVALIAGGLGFQGRASSVYAFGAGPILSLCIDARCESVLSTSALAGDFHLSPTESSTTDHGGALVSPSVVLSLIHHLKLVAEAHVALGTAEVFWVAGLRVPFGPLAVDGGVLQGKLPVGTVTWRW